MGCPYGLEVSRFKTVASMQNGEDGNDAGSKHSLGQDESQELNSIRSRVKGLIGSVLGLALDAADPLFAVL